MRLDLHYDSSGEKPARWWAVVLFYIVLLTILFGVGWFTTTLSDVERRPTPVVTST